MSKIIDAEDILTYARDHVECVFITAGQLIREEGTPIQVVAETAARKIDEAIDLLREYRESGDSPAPAAPDAKPKSPAAVTRRRSK